MTFITVKDIEPLPPCGYPLSMVSRLVLSVALALVALVALVTSAHAQEPAPTETPTVTPNPTATPTPGYWHEERLESGNSFLYRNEVTTGEFVIALGLFANFVALVVANMVKIPGIYKGKQ